MRKAINDNPTVQLAVIGMLLAAFAVVFMTGVMGSKKDEGSGSASPTASAVTGAPPSSSAASAGASAVPAAGSTVAPPAGSAPTTAPSTVSPSAWTAGPG